MKKSDRKGQVSSGSNFIEATDGKRRITVSGDRVFVWGVIAILAAAVFF